MPHPSHASHLPHPSHASSLSSLPWLISLMFLPPHARWQHCVLHKASPNATLSRLIPSAEKLIQAHLTCLLILRHNHLIKRTDTRPLSKQHLIRRAFLTNRLPHEWIPLANLVQILMSRNPIEFAQSLQRPVHRLSLARHGLSTVDERREATKNGSIEPQCCDGYSSLSPSPQQLLHNETSCLVRLIPPMPPPSPPHASSLSCSSSSDYASFLSSPSFSCLLPLIPPTPPPSHHPFHASSLSSLPWLSPLMLLIAPMLSCSASLLKAESSHIPKCRHK